MNAYAKYLVKKLKDIDKDVSRIVIVPCYLNKDGQVMQLELEKAYNNELRKKCVLFGYESDAGWRGVARYISSSNKAAWGYSIKFQYNWKFDERLPVDVNSHVGQTLLENIFMQCMVLSEQQNIYISQKLLFAKGSAYEHMMMAELTT